jgi:alpha-ketoglutarate-dependent taurine dioxygenase
MPTLVEPGAWDEVPVVIAAQARDDLLLLDRDAIVTQFKAHGVVLFRSFSIGVDRLRAFVMSYSNAQIPFPGGSRSAMSEDGLLQAVHAGRDALPLHSELSHTPFRPDICWFYCVRAPVEGSETTLCDGSLLASALPSPIRRALEGRQLRYRITRPLHYLATLLSRGDPAAVKEALRTSSASKYYEIQGDEVLQDFVAPALHRPRFLAEPAFANNIIHNFCLRPGRPLVYPTFADGTTIPDELIVAVCNTARGCTFELRWQDGDLLMFDNTRFMHGRRAIVDPHRTILTQFSDAAI